MAGRAPAIASDTPTSRSRRYRTRNGHIFGLSSGNFIHSSDRTPLVSNYLLAELKAAPIDASPFRVDSPLTPELNGNVKTQL
jgi:hypothetical protein